MPAEQTQTVRGDTVRYQTQFKRTLAKIIAVTLVSLGGASAATAQVDAVQQERASHLETTQSVTVGGAGGHWRGEEATRYLAAPITAVCVCSGNVIDGVQAYYGGIAGVQIGSPGGNCHLTVLSKNQAIKKVNTRSGNFMDSLTFEFNYDSVWHSAETIKHGGNGGNPKTAQSASGGYLAYIEGGGGNYVDRLKFVFAKADYFSGFDADDFPNEYRGGLTAHVTTHNGQPVGKHHPFYHRPPISDQAELSPQTANRLSQLIDPLRDRTKPAPPAPKYSCFKPVGSDQRAWINGEADRCRFPFVHYKLRRDRLTGHGCPGAAAWPYRP